MLHFGVGVLRVAGLLLFVEKPVLLFVHFENACVVYKLLVSL